MAVTISSLTPYRRTQPATLPHVAASFQARGCLPLWSKQSIRLFKIDGLHTSFSFCWPLIHGLSLPLVQSSLLATIGIRDIYRRKERGTTHWRQLSQSFHAIATSSSLLATMAVTISSLTPYRRTQPATLPHVATSLLARDCLPLWRKQSIRLFKIDGLHTSFSFCCPLIHNLSPPYVQSHTFRERHYPLKAASAAFSFCILSNILLHISIILFLSQRLRLSITITSWRCQHP